MPEIQKTFVEKYVRKAIEKLGEIKSRKVSEIGQPEPDVVYFGENSYVIIDWKWTDDKNANYSHQMWRYAKLY